MTRDTRSEEHTSELQSQSNLVCRLLLEKKNQERQLSEELAFAQIAHLYLLPFVFLHHFSTAPCDDVHAVAFVSLSDDPFSIHKFQRLQLLHNCSEFLLRKTGEQLIDIFLFRELHHSDGWDECKEWGGSGRFRKLGLFDKLETVRHGVLEGVCKGLWKRLWKELWKRLWKRGIWNWNNRGLNKGEDRLFGRLHQVQ